MQERLVSASQQYTQTLALRNLLAAKDEDLRNLWQDKEFLFSFPRMAIFAVSSKGRAEFSESQRVSLFALSLKTFLPNNKQTLSGYSFTKDGKVVTGNNSGTLIVVFDNQPELIGQDQKTDSFTRALTASILLIGMSLPDKERQRSLLIESYQNLSNDRKVNLVDSLGRLLAQNNVTRTWIKENKLDADNGFDWDMELAYTLFFGIYTSRIESIFVPQEMQQDVLKYCSLQTRGVMLNFALQYVEKLKRSRSRTKLPGFITQMSEMEMTEDMREKLDLFKQKMSFRQLF